MQKLIFLLFLSWFCFSCGSSDIKNESSTTYYDENNKEISAQKFNKLLNQYKAFEIPAESSLERKLISRNQQGKTDQRKNLDNLLEKTHQISIDAEKPLIIIYHPGADECNQGGIATAASKKKWFDEMEEKIQKFVKVKPIYLYKTTDGLQDRDLVVDWLKDPNHEVENLFFKHHYPYSSYVIIDKNGNYRSYFGEFSKEEIIKDVKKIAKK